MKLYIHNAQIQSIKRLVGSTSGNPRYRVNFTTLDHPNPKEPLTALIKNDAQVSYTIEDYLPHRSNGYTPPSVVIEMNKSKEITNISLPL
jgi:hypothetical protein